MGTDKQEGRTRPLIRLNRKRVVVTAVVLLVLGGCGKLCAGYVHNQRLDKACYQSKMNLHTVQLAVERYATDSAEGDCPASIDEVVKGGYLSQLPTNPFGGMLRDVPGLETPRPMRSLRPGEYCPGDFLYLPVLETYSGGPHVSSYVLVLSGYFSSEYLGRRPPVTPSRSGFYDCDTANAIAEAYRNPSAWQ